MADRGVVLVTGANGFVGRAVVARVIRDATWSVRAAVRRADADTEPGAETVIVGDLGPDTKWAEAVRGARVVVHAAARVHVMKDTAVDPIAAFRRVNVHGTEQLAREAAAAGVKRLVYLSSIKVNGESTAVGAPFDEASVPHPVDPYGASKLEAETALGRVSRETGMQVVIVRPPLVYGPGVKANFRTMMKWVHRGIPLPFGCINNRRSFVAVDNLADLVAHVLDHPRAANETFLASDGEDLSTSELFRRIGVALNRPARLIPVPRAVLATGLTALGKGRIADRVFGNLQVNSSKVRSQLGWRPPVSVDIGLKLAADDYLRGART